MFRSTAKQYSPRPLVRQECGNVGDVCCVRGGLFVPVPPSSLLDCRLLTSARQRAFDLRRKFGREVRSPTHACHLLRITHETVDKNTEQSVWRSSNDVETQDKLCQ